MSTRTRDTLGGQAAIVGIGATEFSKDSGRSELRLAVEAVRAALDDAGLRPADVDGMVTFTMDTNPEITVAQACGIGELSFFSRVHYGGGAACATVQQAALAVAAGVAEVVVCYRAFNERSGRRFGSGVTHREPSAEGAALGWALPFGLLTPASWVAMAAQRYLHTYGLTPEVFGQVAMVDRKYAATNPAAYFHGRPITLAEHAASRWIVEPLRLLDCCQETDGAQAIVVTSVERARDLPRPPAVIAAAAQGAGRAQEQMTSFYRDDLTGLLEMGVVARQLWRTAGLGPEDMDVAILYDHFTPFVLMQLEEFGFCGKGEAADFVAEERLPINTHGGQLGEAYLHGMNGIAEGVRQLRGTAVNQIPGAERVLVTAGTGVPTSGLVLTGLAAPVPPAAFAAASAVLTAPAPLAELAAAPAGLAGPVAPASLAATPAVLAGPGIPAAFAAASATLAAPAPPAELAATPVALAGSATPAGFAAESAGFEPPTTLAASAAVPAAQVTPDGLAAASAALATPGISIGATVPATAADLSTSAISNGLAAPATPVVLAAALAGLAAPANPVGFATAPAAPAAPAASTGRAARATAAGLTASVTSIGLAAPAASTSPAVPATATALTAPATATALTAPVTSTALADPATPATPAALKTPAASTAPPPLPPPPLIPQTGDPQG